MINQVSNSVHISLTSHTGCTKQSEFRNIRVLKEPLIYSLCDVGKYSKYWRWSAAGSSSARALVPHIWSSSRGGRDLVGAHRCLNREFTALYLLPTAYVLPPKHLPSAYRTYDAPPLAASTRTESGS